MKKIFLSLFLFSIVAFVGCTDSTTKNAKESDQYVETYSVARYKLFPTQNMWTFIKLDTQTGQMWQVQFSTKGDKERFEYDLNPAPLIENDKRVNGRFELYPTQNIYNFILLDQVAGKQWQVQWSFDKENQAVMPIYK